MIKNICKYLLPTVLLLTLAAPAFALDMEFYTYGGFNPVTQAFHLIALIFSDSTYTGLIYVIMILGFFAAVGAWIAKAATGARIIPLVWAIPVIFGAAVYLSIFVPKGNITVYDPVINRFETIGEVPDAIVLVAGFLNRIERGMIDIIDTAAAPGVGYSVAAGGMGFKALLETKGSYPTDTFAATSMTRYIKDCVTFELLRPGTSLTLEDLRNNSTDFSTQLALAVNPAIYTVYFDSAHPEGESVTCTQAWMNLRPIFDNPSWYENAVKKACGKATYDPASTVQIQTCKDLIENTVNFTTGLSATPDRIIKQRMIAETLYDFYFRHDPEISAMVESTRKITASGLGTGIAINEWIPIVKAIMTAVAIGMVPFLVIFLPTPIVGKAMSTMLGFFVFLTTWGVTDAVTHIAAMNYAAYTFENIRQSSLGVYSMTAFPDMSTRMLAMFGVVRAASIMLAGVFTMMLIKFGGSTLAHLAGNLTGVVKSAGASSGRHYTPEGTAAALNEQVRAGGMLAAFPEHTYANLSAATAYGMHKQVASSRASSFNRQRLIRSGQLPPGTSSANMAYRESLNRQSAMTESGSSTASLNPDGSGFETQTNAGGSATFRLDGHGGAELTQVKINSVDPLSVKKSRVSALAREGTHSLTSSKNWQAAWSKIQRDSHTNSTAASISQKFSEGVKTGLNTALSEGSDFSRSVGKEDAHRLQKMVQAGAGVNAFVAGINAKGSATIMGTTKDGETVKVDVSQKAAEMFNKEMSRIRSQSMTRAMQDAQGLDYMTRLAKSIGASDAYSYLSKAQEITSLSTSMGMDDMPGFVTARSIARYGDASEANIMRTVLDINDMVTNQGAQGLRQFQNEIGMYESRSGMYSDLALGDLGRFRSQAQGGGVRGQVDPVAATARDVTENISGSDFNGRPEGWRQRTPDIENRGRGIVSESEKRLRENQRWQESTTRGRKQTQKMRNEADSQMSKDSENFSP